MKVKKSEPLTLSRRWICVPELAGFVLGVAQSGLLNVAHGATVKIIFPLVMVR